MNERDPEDEALIAVDALRVVKIMNQDGSHYGWAFECIACDRNHHVTTGWTFNGDEMRPTFSPSVLVQGVEDITDDEADRILAGEQIPLRPYVCHSFVADGRIQYLGDCTHAMAGTTVDLPAVDVRRSTQATGAFSDGLLEQEGSMSREETVGAPPANGVATKPDLVLDANVARMIRSNALDEARRVVARQLHLVPACDVDPIMACLMAIDELRGAPCELTMPLAPATVRVKVTR